MTHKIMEHALKLAETGSVPLGSPIRTPTPPHYSSLHTPPTVIKSGTITQEVIQPYLVHSCHEPLTYDVQFAARYGHESICCPSSAI